MHLTWAPGHHVDVTVTPSDDESAPTVIIWPAFGTPAHFYRHLTPALAAAGLASVVVEYPGRDTADGVGRGTDYGYESLARPVHEAVMDFARCERPKAPVYLLGHSLGGHVSVLAAAAHDPSSAYSPDGLVLVATASPYWRGYGVTGFPRSFIGTALMTTVARGVGYWPGDRLKFWGRQSRVLVSDWARLARTGQLRPAGASIDYMAAMRRYDGDVLAISFPDDALAPVSALEQLLTWIPRAHVTRWHSPTRVGHIQWVRRNETIVPIIAEWVHSHAAERSAASS